MRTLPQKRRRGRAFHRKPCLSPEAGPEHQNNKSGLLEMGWEPRIGRVRPHTASLNRVGPSATPSCFQHWGIIHGFSICAKLMRMRTVVSASASLLALSSSVNGLPSYPVGDPHFQQHPVWTSSTYLGEIDQRSSCRKQ